jgi:hypothetical protein
MVESWKPNAETIGKNAKLFLALNSSHKWIIENISLIINTPQKNSELG